MRQVDQNMSGERANGLECSVRSAGGLQELRCGG